MFKRINHKLLFILALTTALLLALTSIAMAAVWTDQADYVPGSVVTISGDNSDGAGYLPGETVHVDVVGPNGYTAACDAVANGEGAWSCQVMLNGDESAVGEYSYTATGQDSGVSQSGTFTDSRTITRASITAGEDTIPDDASYLTVTGGSTIEATVNVTTDNAGGNQNWRSTSWRIATTASGTSTCVDHTNHDGAGEYSETFNITAPVASGTYNVYFIAWRDDACSSQPSNTYILSNAVVVQEDTTPPVITPNISGTAGDNGWYISDVTVSWTVIDNESTITSMTGCDPTTIDYDTTGVTLECSAISSGGTSSESVTIKRDATAPTISASVSPDRPASGWWNIASGAPTVSFTCNDATSGIASCPIPYTFVEGENLSKSGTAYDNAGNSASAGVTDIDVDLTAPSISASVSPDRPASGWWNIASGAPTVSFTCNDATSGIASCPIPYTFVEGENLSKSGTAYDNAGNSASAGVTDIDVDLTAPSITITSPANSGSYDLNEPVASDYSCSDTTSGVASCSGTVANGVNIDTGSVGPKNFTVTATDIAGNTTNTSASYSVLYRTGDMCLGSPEHQILQPINNDGSSVFKQKSTVPAKFRVCDYYGTSIGTPGVVSSFRLIQISNGTVSSVDEAVDSTTPDTAFRWSPDGQQWIFNINTKSLGAGKTYVYLITLNDGSTIQFQFGLK
jgi:hypothetical protein